MKRIIFITAALLFALSLSAQSNRSRSERSERSSSERKEVTSSSKSTDERKALNRSSRSSSNRNAVSSSSGTRNSSSYRKERSSSESNRPDYRSRSTDSNRSSSNRNSYQRPAEPTRSNRESVRASDRESSSYKSYKPRDGVRYEQKRSSYSYHRPSRVKRTVHRSYHAYKPIEYRRVHYVYRTPPRHRIVWNINMYNQYARWYPDFNLWYYPMGYHISTISAYDAGRKIGEVARVYGEVNSVWYARESDEYHLYIGAPYPYQDLTIVLEGRDARRYSNRPGRYFSGRHVAATALIGIYEGKPEMFLKNRKQLEVY